MVLSFAANVLNNKCKVGHACNSPFNSGKARECFSASSKDEWADVDSDYRLTTFLPPMM